MKKWLYLSVALCLLIGLLGCASDKSNNSPVESIIESCSSDNSNQSNVSSSKLEKLQEMSASEKQTENSDSVLETPDVSVQIITLNYNECGDFGEKINIDGEDCIWYYLPVGTYTANFSSKSRAKGGKLYVASNEMKTNSEGYLYNDLMMELDFMDGDTRKSEFFVVNENEHVEITINSIFNITKT